MVIGNQLMTVTPALLRLKNEIASCCACFC
jgi:hypothetical protein